MNDRDSALIIAGGRVYGHGPDPHQPEIADIHVDGSRIVDVRAPSPRKAEAETSSAREDAHAQVIEAAGKLVIPGFVNAHYHSHDVLLKGYFEPQPLELWVLNALPRAYPRRSKQEIRARTLLGAVECIRGGITTVQDMVTLFPMDEEQVEAAVSAYAEAGIRTILGLQVADVGPLDTVPFWRQIIPRDLQPLLGSAPPGAEPTDPLCRVEDELVRRRGGEPRMTWALAPSSPERCSRAMLTRIAELAARYDLPIYTHLYISKAEALNARRSFAAEHGSLVRLLQSTGLLGPKTSLAHGVWLVPDEMAIIAEAGATVVLNLVSNLKNKNGVAPIRELLAAGVNLALGCDNMSCTDAQNMFQAMKLYCLLAAVCDPRPGPPDALDAFRAATQGGARSAGLDNEIGRIAPGMKADLAILDLADPSFVPLTSVPRQLVYSECGRSVETVIIDGRVVMDRRVIKTVDESALRAEVEAIMPGFRRDAGEVIGRTERLAKYGNVPLTVENRQSGVAG